MKSLSSTRSLNQHEITFCKDRPHTISRITGWKRKLLLAVLLGTSFSGCTPFNRNPQRESLVDAISALFSEEPEALPSEDHPDSEVAAPDSSTHIARSE